MSEEHHTEEEVDLAFRCVPKILRKLKDAGVELPSVRLFYDASGSLDLGDVNRVTDEQAKMAEELIRSRRWSVVNGHAVLTSCCGFVSFAKEMGIDG